MTAAAERLTQLRAARRRTVQALSDLRLDNLLVDVGPARNANVRYTLLSLGQDDDQRCAAVDATLAALDWRPSAAQRILASLALTRSQLRAALVGLTDEQFEQPAGPEEWAVRQALEHIMNNEGQFLEDARYAIKRLQSAAELPVQNPSPGRGPGALPPPVPGGLEAVLDLLEQVRDEVVAAAQAFGTEELRAPAMWAGTPYDVRFLLHRRANHEREHTVQVWKTLQAIGRTKTEAELILAQAEVARGALEGRLLGLPDEVFGQEPGNGSPSVEALLAEAQAQEEARVGAILAALS